ncbi:E3 ubiquitin-protein ligase MIEL1 [Zea mays]|uniref:E3 ubiquitin-protein ligase MIEL1 n=1 Tax=Zea mays TaxID=4577 RepID=A0A317YCS1_MAIZE|nr:E3 ubiquitin-protein ligase MIEL1 [Zea mays]
MDSEAVQHGLLPLSACPPIANSCAHYSRGCSVVAPCCGQAFGCRHCHNDAKVRWFPSSRFRFGSGSADVLKQPCPVPRQNSLEVDPRDRHEIPRHEIKKVICSLCSKEQDVQQNCSSCGACMGKYFCKVCKFFDDDVSKGQYHCDGCGICRTGGVENFFHCDKCGCCYSNVLKDSHHCVERAMHHNCPVCFEYLFDSTKDISVLQCGHTIHLECMNEMRAHHHFSCPVCSRSACDMSATWRKLDEEVAATPMPDIYQKHMVWILCNDCSATSSVRFHVLGHKCPACSSYNTRETRAVCPRI